jgi:GntR family transcriptional regulator
MEIRGMLDTQQGTGTFVAEQQKEPSKEVRERQLGQLVNEFVSRAGSAGITVNELIDALREFSQRGPRR